jgi:hypothetical protein
MIIVLGVSHLLGIIFKDVTEPSEFRTGQSAASHLFEERVYSRDILVTLWRWFRSVRPDLGHLRSFLVLSLPIILGYQSLAMTFASIDFE